MRRWAVRGLLLLLAVLALPVAQAQPAPGLLPLSPLQREYLVAHPTIVVGQYDSGWPPFESLRDGEQVGLGPDYLSHLARQLGVKVEARRYPDWTSVLDAACRGEIDVVMNVGLSADRTRCMVYTAAYSEAPLALVGRPDDLRASDMPDLDGLRVVIEQDFLTGPQVRARFPRARQLVANDTLSALQMVIDDKADVYIGNAFVATELIASRRLQGVALLRPSDLPPERLHFGIPNSKQPLAEALDLALAATSQAQRDALAQRWLSPPHWSASAQLALSQAEKRVLEQPLMIGFAPNAAPLSFTGEDGRPSGLASEYLQRLMQAGANLKVENSHDWYEVREKARRGELQAVMGIPVDSRYLGPDWVFSQPFISVPNVIVVRSDGESLLGLADLQGKRVLLSDPERVRGYVQQQAPQARIIAARSAEQALQRLLEGEADAYVGNLAVVDHLLRSRFPGRMQVAAPAGFNDQLALAVDRRHAALATTFDRLLLQMTPRKREALRSAWLAVEYRNGVDWSNLLRWGVPVLMVLLTALLVHGVGHWRLRREVAGRRQLEQRLAEVTDNLPAVVYQARRDADGTLSFPFIAGDLPALFGITRQQAEQDARVLLERVEQEDRARILHSIEQAAHQFAPLILEFRLRSDGEGVRWVRSQAHPYAAEEGAVIWSGYWVDVSEARMQADALAAAKADAEQAAEAKSRFLATMSHEIRTPMSGVLGMLEVLAHSPLDSEQQRILGVIEDSAQMLRQILDDILDYSRLEAGALRLEPVPQPLRPLLESVCRLMSAQASARGLELHVQIDPQLAAAHEVDGVRLRQIVFNLLSNAIKFTARGEVRLQLEVLGPTADDGSQPLCLSVTDTGIGIAPEQLQHLFAPFTQAGAYIQRDHGGTGLGLSICQRLVQMMGGELELHSTLGEGTRAEVRLALVEAGRGDVEALVAEQEQAALLPPALREARVLVIEDHPTNQAMMAWRLQQLGVPHVLLGDGQQALDRLSSESFDLVITDCRMPVLDGFGFTRLLREREGRTGQPRLTVLALTASVLDDDARRCREAGMDEVLAKPLSLATLRTALLRWLPQAQGQSFDAPVQETVADDAEVLPDLATLQQRYGSRAVAEQLRDSLLQASESDLAAVQRAVRAGDRETAALHLHRQAGGLGAIGASALAGQANALVERLQDATEADPAPVFAAVTAFVARLQHLLQRLAH
ncbi:transporter substrate-binding domain-containing protein [Stenotrophomonas maltophilia]|uniref:ATP-binding protein n=1 Tax=Stenotrophomonas maltophilia TaxID=40324 RepID=UPI0019D4E0AF|nr:transporter substrate-binding domain-containing protein [Stenotrophomonas maltophilia]MBN7828628.1 transporter substrate-binding domain-containing protein [Stenotrophomonas maltophilia]MBN7833283.1 transporter substrate-binding domain-containing protein [Stenotrophomonas maltophilia]MBN7856926.1 transporter substrate-binding domain-containing protein [Stenotrophomonas maltophilia]MBN7917419.1 transporter substrate-binding domain-containing protein [Stenotrophomonas maltophilia]MBO2844884.1 